MKSLTEKTFPNFFSGEKTIEVAPIQTLNLGLVILRRFTEKLMKISSKFLKIISRLDGTWTWYLRVLAGCNSTVRPASSTRKPGNVRPNQQQIWAQVDCCLISREWVNPKLLRRSLRRQGRCQVPRSRWRSLGGLGQKSSSLENWLAKAHTRVSSWLRLVGFEKVIKSVNKNNIPLKTKSLVSKSQTYSIVVFSV